MSNLLHEIQRAVNEEIIPNIPKLSSEKARRDMRSNLLALEKMIKHIRQQLLKESKDLTLARKQQRNNKKNKIKNNSGDIDKNETEEDL